MKLKQLIFVNFLFFTYLTLAQTSKIQFGIKAGVNRSSGLVSDAVKIKLKTGYHIGGIIDYSLSSKFRLETGLLLSQKGGKFVGYNSGNYDGGTPNYKHKFNALYLEIPISIQYKQRLSEKWSLNFGAGTYFAYGILGKTRIDTKGSYSDGTKFREWNTFENTEEYLDRTLNRFDMGWGLNFEVVYNKLFLGIDVEVGLIDILRKYENEGYTNDLTFYNFNVPFSIGYRF